MDNVTLKKKLSTYLTEKGYLKNVSNELLYEILVAWENWSGSTKEFYQSVGFSHTQLASLIGRAKKLKRDGHFGSGDFKEIVVENPQTEEDTETSSYSNSSKCRVELVWDNGKVIRFFEVDLLLEFLKKAA